MWRSFVAWAEQRGEWKRLKQLHHLEIDRLLPHSTDGEDVIPEPPVNPVSRPGDLWLLGKHRLLRGDATSATEVAL